VTRAELISLLNGDLMRERTHMSFYLYAASQVTGSGRVELSEFFMGQAASEMKHVKEFQDVILELGGEVSQVAVEWCHNPKYSDPATLLGFALSLEDEVVEHYTMQIRAAEKLGGSEGQYVALFLEDQLLDSKTDAANIRRMLMS
jgi:ferritin